MRKRTAVSRYPPASQLFGAGAIYQSRVKTLTLILLVVALALGRAQGDAIPQITVAHSWGDLFAAAPIAVDGASAVFPDSVGAISSHPAQVNVWLGIDRDSVSSHGAAVLYCASKGASFYSPNGIGLGPFDVVVHAPKNATRMAELQEAVQQLRRPRQLHGSTFALSAHTVTLGESGEYEIELVQHAAKGATAPGKIVAQVTVEVTADVAMPWVPWGEPSADAQSLQDYSHWEQRQVTAAVSNPSGGAAVPKAPPEPFYYAQTPDNTTPLPQLIPEQADPQSQLTLLGNTLVYSGKRIHWVFPQDYFLTRWWVNDQPCALPLEMGSSQSARCFSGQVPAADPTSATFQLDFQPDRLGIKKGDKVGVQLLNCPGGYQNLPCAKAETMDLMADDAEVPWGSFSFLSNRVDFVYSGDPKHPVAQ